jgi:hypothetical protein
MKKSLILLMFLKLPGILVSKKVKKNHRIYQKCKMRHIISPQVLKYNEFLIIKIAF